MNQGGINNPALIGASQREARNKLDTMAGIQRPGGIMASSPQLMQAAMPARPPVMPARPPVMPQSPARMVGAPMAPPGMPAAPAIDSLPNIPMPTTVAPRSMDPMAAAPTTGQPVVKLAGGGEPFRPQFQGDVPASAVRLSDKPAGSVDLGLDSPEFMEAIKGLTEEGVNDALKLFGGPAGVVKRDRELENGLKDVMTGREATPAKIAAKTLELAGVPDTAEGRMDFAETLGFDTNDIGALDDKIMEVLMAGQSTDFQQAVLMGLQNYKSTAMARAAGAASAAGGSKTAASRSAKNAYQDAYLKAMGAELIEIPKGMTKEEYAIKYAEQIIARTYSPEEIAAAKIQMGPSAIPRPRTTDQPPTTPGTRYKDTKTGKIMVVGPDGTPTEE